MNVKMTLRRNSPKLLAILAAMGTVSTAFATARATPKALLLIQEAEAQKGEDLTALEKVKVAAVPYIPAVLLGSATIVCIFGAQMLNRKTQSSMASAYALLDQGFKDYRRKLKELYGDEADKKVIEALAVEKSQTVYEMRSDETKIVIAGIMAYTIYRVAGKCTDARIAIAAMKCGVTMKLEEKEK